MRPFISVMKNKLFSDHFFFQAVVFCLFFSIHCLFNGPEIAFARNMLSLLTVNISYFVNGRDPYSYKCNVK